MDSAVHVAIVVEVEVCFGVDYLAGLLGCGGVVEVDELFAVYLPVQDWEVSADLFGV
jgi:hypothetical protein